MSEKLRPYQSEGIDEIFKAWREGCRSVLFQMPTGTGKTVLFSDIVRRGFEHDRKILIVVHRRELVDQITEKLEARNVEVGLIIAGHKSNHSKIVQIASIQTLTRREPPEADLIIIDECHHAKAKTYRKLWDIYPDAKFLGVTATPWRLSGEGFEDLFDTLICSMSVKEFINQGHLCPVVHYASSIPDLSKVKIRQGDYMTSMISDVMSQDSIMADLVQSYQEHCEGKSTIVFAVSVDHSQQIVERYLKEGISAAHVDSKTPKEERTQILNDFRNRKIQVVSNVEIITEGFDFPECEAVQLARPTKSLALYLQMVGRVMRRAKDKQYGIILDNAGLWKDHGLSDADRQWTLEPRQRKRGRKKNEPITVLAETEEGSIRLVERYALEEVKGLKLIPISEELKRLVNFETFVSYAIHNSHKSVSTFYKYEEYLKRIGKEVSAVELEYMEKRITNLDKNRDEEFRLKPSFWHWRKHELKKRENEKANAKVATKRSGISRVDSKRPQTLSQSIERKSHKAKQLSPHEKNAMVPKSIKPLQPVVDIGSIVELADSFGQEMKVRFTRDKEEQSLYATPKVIHASAPLAQAVLGKSVGDKCILAHKGAIYRVKKIMEA